MELKNIKEKIKNFNFNYIKYINSETKELSNKVIIFSSIIIFLNLNYLSISELEITGLKITVNKSFLVFLLFFINTYFFLQFKNSLKIDTLLAKIPNEFTEICKTITRILEQKSEEAKALTAEIQKALDEKDYDEEKLKIFNARTEEMNNDSSLDLPRSWMISATASMKYHRRNTLLNQIFPQACYYISLLSLIIILLNILGITAALCNGRLVYLPR